MPVHHRKLISRLRLIGILLWGIAAIVLVASVAATDGISLALVVASASAGFFLGLCSARLGFLALAARRAGLPVAAFGLVLLLLTLLGLLPALEISGISVWALLGIFLMALPVGAWVEARVSSDVRRLDDDAVFERLTRAYEEED